MAAVDVCNRALTKLGQDLIDALTDENENARKCNLVYEPARDELLEKNPWGFAKRKVALVNVTKPAIDIWVTATAYAVDDVVEYNSLHYTCLVAHTSDVFTVNLASADWELTTDWATTTSYALGAKVYHTGVHYSCVVVHTSEAWATDLAVPNWVATVKAEFELTVVYRLPTDNLRVLKMSVDADYKVENKRLYTDELTCSIKYIRKVTDTDEFPESFTEALVGAIADKLALSITQSRTIASDIKVDAKEKKLEGLGVNSQKDGTPNEPKSDEWLDAR